MIIIMMPFKEPKVTLQGKQTSKQKTNNNKSKPNRKGPKLNINVENQGEKLHFVV